MNIALPNGRQIKVAEFRNPIDVKSGFMEPPKKQRGLGIGFSSPSFKKDLKKRVGQPLTESKYNRWQKSTKWWD